MALALVAPFALLAGCGQDTSGAEVEFDEGLERAIAELAHSEGSRPLEELAPGGWTSVRVLTGPATGERIEQELGKPIELDGDGALLQDGNLLVFQRDGEIVRVVSLGQLAALRDGEYRADVALLARGGAITMTDPDGSPAGR